MSDRLVEIPIADLPKLRDLYKDRKAEASAYNTIQNYIDWFKKDPSLDFAKFYSLNGDWSDGTFVITDSYLILFDTLDRTGGGTNRLKVMLCLLDYSSLRVMNGYDSRLQLVVDEVIEQVNLNENHKLNSSYDLYVLHGEIAAGLMERAIPDGLSLAPLDEGHAELIDKIWDFRHEGSLYATRRLIQYGKSLGAFTSDGSLAGWIIVQQTGTLGLLKVHEDYRRLGIAKALIARIAKSIAETGQDVMILISPENIASRNLFRSLGFRREMNNVLTFNTLTESQDRLLVALHCLDRDAQYLFSGISTRLLPTVEKYLKQLRNITTTPSMTVWYHIPKEQALEFETEPPEGVTLASLRQEHVDTVNNIWPHRAPKSELFVSNLISKNITLGAFDKEGNLLAWIFQLPVGSLGILHVKDEHKRKGYGSLMVRAMSKIFAEKGIEVTAPVVHTNTPSREMFKKLNFKEIDRVYWWMKPATN